jgi:hypothetical protein
MSASRLLRDALGSPRRKLFHRWDRFRREVSFAEAVGNLMDFLGDIFWPGRCALLRIP